MKRPNQLAKNPVVKETMKKILTTVAVKKEKQSREMIVPGERTRALLYDPEIHNMFEKIIDETKMPDEHKLFIKKFFYHNWKPTDLFELIHNRKPKDEKESDKYADKILNSRAMEEFREVIRVFYASVLPITATKKMELLLNPDTKGGVKLEVIKDIEAIAQVGGDQKPVQLPYNVTINIPVQQNTQVNNKEE